MIDEHRQSEGWMAAKERLDGRASFASELYYRDVLFHLQKCKKIPFQPGQLEREFLITVTFANVRPAR